MAAIKPSKRTQPTTEPTTIGINGCSVSCCTSSAVSADIVIPLVGVGGVMNVLPALVRVVEFSITGSATNNVALESVLVPVVWVVTVVTGGGTFTEPGNSVTPADGAVVVGGVLPAATAVLPAMIPISVLENEKSQVGHWGDSPSQKHPELTTYLGPTHCASFGSNIKNSHKPFGEHVLTSHGCASVLQ
jgi:hypothetical protein